MNLHALHHQPSSNYAYAYDGQTLHLRLRTAKGDADRVLLRAGDPYHWEAGGGGGNLNAEGALGWMAEEVAMTKETSTELFDFWIVAIKPPFRRLRYGFILFNEAEKIFFGENCIIDLLQPQEEDVLNQVGNFFCCPFLNEADVFKAPEWAKSTVWYQIFPERFANGNSKLDPEGVLEWGSCDPAFDSFFGGDLQGIINRLDYLADLGITGLYLCPIFTSPSTHKYDTSDYFEVDPNFGDKETLRQLVEQAHARGIRVMLDAVFNHCGTLFEPWQDVLKNGEKSPYRDWFHIRKFPLIEADNLPHPINYDAFAFAENMPKLNTDNPEVVEYFLEVGRYWVREFNIDGWRLDVANEVDHAFWRRFRQELRKIKDDIYILGEIWHDARPWLAGDQFDAVMNYPLTNAIIDFIAKGKTKATDFQLAINTVMTQYAHNVNEVNFNLLDSHDTTRLLTLCENDKNKALLAFTFLMTQTGSVCLYYGSEIGLDGGADPLCRKCMVWDEEKQDLNMLETFKKLIKLRKHYPALFAHQLEWLMVDDLTNTILFQKVHPSNNLYIALNNNKEEQVIDLSTLPKGTYVDLLTDKKVVSDKELSLAPHSAAFLIKA